VRNKDKKAKMPSLTHTLFSQVQLHSSIHGSSIPPVAPSLSCAPRDTETPGTMSVHINELVNDDDDVL